MVRLGGVILPGTKAAVIAGFVALLAIVALFAIRQFHPISATGFNSSGQVQSLNSQAKITNSQITSASPDTSGDSLNIDTHQSSDTSLTVNGQKIDVPQNGQVNQTLTNGDKTTTVNVNSNSTKSSNGMGSNSSHSSVNVHVSSNSSETSL